MAKRMTDTDKWKKPFIKSLPVEYKLFWLYLLDECDHAGIWHVELDLAEIRLGIKLSLQKIRGLFKEKVVEFDNGSKWFIPDFISFQYGELDVKNRAHSSVISKLSKYKLIHNKGHTSPLQGAKDKAMDMDKDMVEDGGTGEDSKNTPLVHQMLHQFKNQFPDYHQDEEKDFPALLGIAYKIGKGLELSKHEVLNGSQEKVKTRWGEILPVISSDKWYSQKNISFINHDWQQVIQLFNRAKNGTGKSHSKQPASSPGRTIDFDPL